MENEVKNCRICSSTELENFLYLGNQALTGVFPDTKSSVETYGELTLCKCKQCDLVQLKHRFPMNQMYGDNYGYRSGLNHAMVSHLENSVHQIQSIVHLQKNDLVIDIGSNDGTLLGFYPRNLDLQFLGIDPVGPKFKQYYKKDIELIADFFPSPQMNEKFGSKKAKVITSYSCFYDLENPIEFAKNIALHLDTEGVWVFEQSYLPSMIQTLSYDTVCHEHLEYYCLKQICYIAKQANLKIIDVSFNEVNGGSFCVTAAHVNSKLKENTEHIEKILKNEKEGHYYDIRFYEEFAKKVLDHKNKLSQFLGQLKSEGKKIAALGASTKGNVVLQYCNLNSSVIEAVGEVNPFKYSKYTPGSKIPIVSEDQINSINPDYKLVLPWHFKDGFIQREKQFIEQGGKLIFALPTIEVYPPESL